MQYVEPSLCEHRLSLNQFEQRLLQFHMQRQLWMKLRRGGSAFTRVGLAQSREPGFGQIGTALRDKQERHTVVVRSTVLPGTVKNVVIPLIEAASGKKAGVDFGVATNPEFLRESTAIKDYDFPAMTVIGELDEQSGDLLQELYSELDAPIIRKSIEVAEMIKYTCNVWHAAKVTFANEIGNIAKAAGVDGREVMDVVCQDHKLNLSKYYMKPGFAFGGSCLPKDVRALTYKARSLDLDLPVLNAILPSNQRQIERAKNFTEVADQLTAHRAETEQQITRLEQLLGQFDETPSGLKDAALSLGGSMAAMGHVFAEDEIGLTDDLALTLGLRWDDHKRYGDHWSPRAYAVWSPSETLTIKGGVSTGFRAPSLQQQFFAAAATNNIGGVLVDAVTLPVSNPVAVALGATVVVPVAVALFVARTVVAVAAIVVAGDGGRAHAQGGGSNGGGDQLTGIHGSLLREGW